MNLKPKKQSKTFLALALMLTISLMASTQLLAVNGQTSGTITINNGAAYTNSTAVTLTLSATNATTEMCFSNDSSIWTSWETYTTTKTMTIPNIEGTETVYVQYRDSGNQTSSASASIIYDITPPTIDPFWQLYGTNTIYFDASASTDSNGIANSTWNLGDGNITYGYRYFTHTYATIGNYPVTVTLTDVAGNSASATMNVTVPDVSTIATPTPAPTVTVQPTFNPTEQPTASPTATGAPATELDPLTTVVLVGAIGIIVVVILAIFLVLKRKPKAAKPQEQQSKPAQSPPPQQKPEPSTPSGPSESNFNI